MFLRLLNKFFEITHLHTINSEDSFKMKEGFDSFQKIQKGVEVATSNKASIYSNHKGLIFMPLYQKKGAEGYFIIKTIKPFYLNLSVFLRRIKIDNLLVWLPGISWQNKPTTPQGINNSGTQSSGAQFNVNLPIASPAAQFAVQVAKLSDNTILDLELSALERENKGEIVASPRITAANQYTSRIEQGSEIPYVQAAASGATSVTFKKAVLSLEVTPQITPDQRIILQLSITQDARGDVVSTPTGPAVAIDTQEIKTQVLVENGETIVLGGIFQQISTDDVTKVPILGDLPVMGGLFRNKVSIEQKRELLIFVTPKIIIE